MSEGTETEEAGRVPAGSEARPSFTVRIGMWCARRRWRVAGAWVLLLVVALVGASIMGTNTGAQGEAPGEAGEAYTLISERFPAPEGEAEGPLQEIVVVSHPSLGADDPQFRGVVEGLLTDLRALRVQERVTVGGTAVTKSTRLVVATASHYDLGLPGEQSPFVARTDSGGAVTFALVQLDGGAVDFENLDNVALALDAVAQAQAGAPEGFEVLIGGPGSLFYQLLDIIEEDFARASYINLPVTFFLLVLAFGALVAAGVPIILAFGAIALAISVLAFFSQVIPMTEIYIQVVLLMGLATGIDYSLFVISRYRNERQSGQTKEDALRTATGTSTKAIFFAGATTVFAVLGMFIVGDPIFTSLGLAAAVVVALAVFGAMTLLPALIAILGDSIDRLRLPFMERLINRPARRGWERVVDAVLARPVLPAVVTVVLLLAVTAPVVSINMGFNGPRSFPRDAEGTQALIKLEEHFTLGLVQPAVVVVDAGEKENVFAANVQAAVERMVAAIQADTASAETPQGLYGPMTRPPEFNDAGDTAQIFVPLNGDSGDQRAIDAVNHLRSAIIPAAFEESQARALVAGATADSVDFRQRITDRTPWVMGFVLLTAFVILLLTFHSLTIAITAMVLNLLSVGVAYGLLVLVFQEGWLLEGLLGFEATGIIESWLPLFLFTILFGASMDYEMFVMGRIKEAYERGLNTEQAIAEGIKKSAGVITNAAAIMVAVAFIFVFMRDLSLKQFGFGLGVAVLVDATIIRAFLLPTTMKLLGDWNWYLPSWLNWLPSLPMGEEPASGTAKRPEPQPAKQTGGGGG